MADFNLNLLGPIFIWLIFSILVIWLFSYNCPSPHCCIWHMAGQDNYVGLITLLKLVIRCLLAFIVLKVFYNFPSSINKLLVQILIFLCLQLLEYCCKWHNGWAVGQITASLALLYLFYFHSQATLSYYQLNIYELN